ncbi:MAG: hypothetical protein ACOCTM_04480, partial [Bacteroidota bacterium]
LSENRNGQIFDTLASFFLSVSFLNPHRSQSCKQNKLFHADPSEAGQVSLINISFSINGY